MTPKKVAITALVVMNCFLLVLLLNASGTVNLASGQLAGTSSDRAGDYLAVTGQIGANEQVLYVINTRTDQMLVLRYYRVRQHIEVLGMTNLLRDFGRGLPEWNTYRPMPDE